MRALLLFLVLLLAGVDVVDGKNPCFDKCKSGDTIVRLDGCDLTDDDIPDVVDCLDTVGRYDIKDLYLNWNRLTTLPLLIFHGLANVENLYLHVNNLSSLQFGVFDRLGGLKVLVLAYNQLTTLPEGIFTDLLSLESLIVKRNKLSSLPLKAFKGLDKLYDLTLSNNQLTTLPDGLLSDLGSLTQLYLQGNPDLQCVPANGATDVVLDNMSADQCECIPEEAVFCDEGWLCEAGAFGYTCGINSCLDPDGDNYRCTPGEVTLDLENCGLTDDDIPGVVLCMDGVGRDNIKFLRLHDNLLADIPPDLFQGLVSLTYIKLSENRVKALPLGIFDGIETLVTLDLSDNALTILPVDIFQGLVNLRFLFLNDNSLSSLPLGLFDGLGNLEAFLGRRNEFTTLPEGLFEDLGSLTDIWLYGNPDLQCVPANDATYLETNDISFIQCECFPEEAVSCDEGLFCAPGEFGYTCDHNPCLDPDGDNYKCTPGNIEVNLENCGLTDDVISDLVRCLDGVGRDNIEYLNLGENPLTALPAAFFQGLVGLTDLNLAENNLSALPPGLFDGLAKLNYLYLEANFLTTLPQGLFNDLESLHYLRLDNNDLSTLLPELFDGPKALYTLYLSYNQLTTFPKGVFDGLSPLLFLYLEGNPDLQCVPEADDIAVYADGLKFEKCECTLSDAVLCDEGFDCVPGESGYTCEWVPTGKD